MCNIHAIILAAGDSSRYGSPKQLLPWNGGTLLQHAIRQARSACDGRVSVVLGAGVDAILPALANDGIASVYNPNWEEGMASSIRAGITALPPSAGAALFLLCDQPLIRDKKLSGLVDCWYGNPGSIVASRYNDTLGVPAIFPRSHFDALLALEGDRGAKQVINSCPGRVRSVAIPEAAIDIDTRDDLENLISAREPTGVHHDNAHD